MARASTPTLLSLDRFAALASLHPVHFNQLYITDLADSAFCSHALMQHSWQSQGGVAREEIALAIASAEMDIKNYVGYSVAPEFFDKLINPVRSFRANGGTSHILLNLPDGYVQSGGFRATTLIENDVAIVYSDTDADGYLDRATVTTTVPVPTGTRPEEIHAVYPGKDANDRTWNIRAQSVSIDGGGIATIILRREWLVKEEVQEALDARAQDGMLNTNFLTTMDVYRVRVDPSVQSSFLFNSGCANCALLSGGDCNVCGYTESEGCLQVINSRLGQVSASLGTWNTDSFSYVNCGDFVQCGPLAKVRAQYVAGYPLEISNGVAKMQTRLELAVTRLAMAKLDRPMCECESVQATMAYWTQDMASTVVDSGGAANTRQISQALLDSEFGTTRGGLWVFGLLRNDRVPISR